MTWSKYHQTPHRLFVRSWITANSSMNWPKKEKETKKKQHVVVTKEIRLRPKIEEHDFEFKLRHARKFLESGHRVKATVMFRGRENAHKEYGERVLDRFSEGLDDIAKIDKEAKLEGGQLIMFFTKK